MSFDYKKSLGQNFLKDKNIINKIVSSISPSKNDLIIEIGPGDGSLTKELVNKDCDLLCFEIDERLRDKLNSIKSNSDFNIVFKDFLKVDLNEYISKKYNHLYFVGNLPYYITTAIINKIVNESSPYEITIMIQKEVANRYMAKPCSRDYGSISVFLQYYFDIYKVCDVSKKCFEPIPKVDSMVIKLKNKNKKEVKIDLFNKFVRDSFKHKRKNLRNNLMSYDLNKIEVLLKEIGKSLTNRAEELSVDDFIYIVNRL